MITLLQVRYIYVFSRLAVPLTIAFTCITAQAQLSSFVSGTGTCTSQSAWTQKALDHSIALAETIRKLKEDENCKVFASSLRDAPFFTQSSSLQQGNQAQLEPETLMQELSTLKSVMQSSPVNSQAPSVLGPILAKATLDAIHGKTKGPTISSQAADLSNLKTRFQLAGNQALDFADEVFTRLPQHSRCLQSRPDLVATLAVASVQIGSAFSSGGPAVSSKFASTLGSFLNFLQEQKFAKLSKSLDQMKFWSEISCLVEATQTNYCSVQDGHYLFEDQKRLASVTWVNSPLEGYYLMAREVPELTNWLRQIQIGIEPRLKTDAQFKIDTLQSMMKLQQDVFSLPAIYHENYNTVYSSLTDPELKRQNIRKVIWDLTDAMVRNIGGNTVNFFDLTVPSQQIPFFLLGRDSIPPEIIAPGAAKIHPNDYLLDIEKTSELKNPDEAMARILVRLKEISDKAMISGSNYFRTRMNVDQMNLIDEAVTSNAVSARQSLKNISAYLARLYHFLKANRESQTVLLSIVDSINRLNAVIAEFDKLDRISKQMQISLEDVGRSLRQNGGKNADLSTVIAELNPSVSESNQAAIESVVSSVYLKMNILLQRDGFFSTRLATYVRHEYFTRARKGEDFSQYATQLILTAGRTLISQLESYQNFNLAASKSDLDNAQVINMQNLATMEKLVMPHMEEYLLHLNRRVGRNWARTRTMNPFEVLLGRKRFVLFASKQDTKDEAEAIRAKVCMQTLGFQQFRKFKSLCHDAKLESLIESKDGREKLQLTFDYNELYRQKVKGDGNLNKKIQWAVLPSPNRFEHTCVLRDYFRNHHVSIMTKNFSQE